MDKIANDRSIGGFLGLEELAIAKNKVLLPGVLFASGRSCLVAVLEHVRPRRIYIPFYTCDSVIRACQGAHVAFSFYNIGDDLLPISPIEPEGDEMILLINYFGCLSPQLRTWASKAPERTIIDNTQ